MDLHGLSALPDAFPIDDLLDLSNDDLFSSPPSDQVHPPPPDQPSPSSARRLCADSSSASASSSSSSPPSSAVFPPSSADFAHELCIPSDYAAELEWLSRFVDDSFTDILDGTLAGTPTAPPEAVFSGGRPRSKSSRPPGASPAAPSRIRPPATDGAGLAEAEGGARRCAHCASEKTPQWRAGPLGPKTLCNACGVRYKSGRLVPEYRPAASPTFVLTQHSNSHRKVMELRRQKEARQPQQQQQHHHHQGKGGGQASGHPRNFDVC